MFSFFYDVFLGLYVLISFPKILINLKKYRFTITKRFFFRKKDFSVPKDCKVVWIHAVSLGETRAIASLAAKIKKENNNIYLILSSITKTGYEAASSMPFVDKHIYLPLDFSFLMKRLLNYLKPHLVLIAESDLWYNFLRFSKKNKAKIALVNGKLSLKSFKRYQFFSFYAKKIFSHLDLFCLQNESLKQRFQTLGLNNLKVSGNLKFDNKPVFLSNEELACLKNIFKIDGKIPVITLASTHAKEEEILLSLFGNKQYKIFLAPRHPERLSKVKNILKEKAISFCSLSKIDSLKEEKVILIDKMGFLNTLYQLSDLAIVGGSFVPSTGGHNILEPIFVSTPVFFGPYMWAQEELKDLAIRSNSGKEVNLETLEKETQNYFLHTAKEMRANCKILSEELSGQTEKTYNQIKEFL